MSRGRYERFRMVVHLFETVATWLDTLKILQHSHSQIVSPQLSFT